LALNAPPPVAVRVFVVPAAPLAGVYENVCGVPAFAGVNVSELGVKMPPPLASVRAIVSFEASAPLSVTI
jgi:hypothetical protein